MTAKAYDRRAQSVANIVALKHTLSGCSDGDGHVDVTCPWGNRLRCHAPGIARFYETVFGMSVAPAADRASVAVPAEGDQALAFRETARPLVNRNPAQSNRNYQRGRDAFCG